MSTSYAIIHTYPGITDPKELHTKIVACLRSLFGDCQGYSVGLEILKCRPISSHHYHPNNNKNDNTWNPSNHLSNIIPTLPKDSIIAIHHDKERNEKVYEAIISCPIQYMPYVRAAITYCSSYSSSLLSSSRHDIGVAVKNSLLIDFIQELDSLPS